MSTLNLDVSKLVFEKFAYKNRASNIIKNFFKVLAGIPDNKFNEKTLTLAMTSEKPALTTSGSAKLLTSSSPLLTSTKSRRRTKSSEGSSTEIE